MGVCLGGEERAGSTRRVPGETPGYGDEVHSQRPGPSISWECTCGTQLLEGTNASVETGGLAFDAEHDSKRNSNRRPRCPSRPPMTSTSQAEWAFAPSPSLC